MIPVPLQGVRYYIETKNKYLPSHKAMVFCANSAIATEESDGENDYIILNNVKIRQSGYYTGKTKRFHDHFGIRAIGEEVLVETDVPEFNLTVYLEKIEFVREVVYDANVRAFEEAKRKMVESPYYYGAHPNQYNGSVEYIYRHKLRVIK